MNPRPNAPSVHTDATDEPETAAASDAAEARLVDRAKAGERIAFEELVRRHADRLYGVVLRFVASAEEAEEVTQEAFLRAWRGIGRFEGRSQFFTWLYRIGINEAKRRAERSPPSGLMVSTEEQPVYDTTDPREVPAAQVERVELRAVLEQAVRALPIEYRGPIILRDIEGLSTTQAAAVLELGDAALKSRLHRARMTVRKAIDSYLDVLE